MSEREQIPAEGTLEYVDYLLDSYEAEIRLSERYNLRLDSIAFYRDMLHAAYQQIRERAEKAPERNVVIEVLGGVAYVASRPDGIAVEIIDYDNDDDNDHGNNEGQPSAFDDALERADMPKGGDARDEA